jgi:hypothetical protein
VEIVLKEADGEYTAEPFPGDEGGGPKQEDPD